MFTFFSVQWEHNFEWKIRQDWQEEAIVYSEVLSSIYTADKGKSQEDYLNSRHWNQDSNNSPPE
jgi:hypothetical protein